MRVAALTERKGGLVVNANVGARIEESEGKGLVLLL